MAAGYNNNEEIDQLSYDNIHYVSCAACQSAQIYSDRYQCLQCDHYNLCGNCFEERRQTKAHSSGHAVVHFRVPNELFGRRIQESNQMTLKKTKELFHAQNHRIQCDKCEQTIIGIRFKCDTCYNYNLCFKCMEQRAVSKNHQNTHPLVVASDENLLHIDVADIHYDKTKAAVGKGGFGKVYKATWLSKKRIVACKVIEVTPAEKTLEESFWEELAAYTELSGAFILKTFGYGEEIGNNRTKKYYLISEFMHRKSLTDVIYDPTEKISLRRKLAMACHITSGMQKLHAHSMIHRDIRPDNILVSSNYTAKIGDMGIAHVFKPAEKHKLLGCLIFMPPEFYRGDGYYDQSLDVFTYGLTLNELFTERKHYFNKATQRVTLKEQSPIFADLINQCIDDESNRRPTASELQDTLLKFRRALDKHIDEEHPNYKKQTLAAKNSIVAKFYNEFQKQESVVESKTIYAAPPRPRLRSNLFRQHFNDMMEQFRTIQQVDFHEEKDWQGSSRFMKWEEYFNDDGINAIHVERRRRFVSPTPNFRRVHEENHQPFANNIQHRRSPILPPMPSTFDDLRKPLEQFHFDANFNQQFFQMRHIKQQFK